MKGHVRKSTQADVDYLANNLRPEDAIEVLSSHGNIKEALQIGLDESDECWTFVVSDTDEVAGMFGVGKYDEDIGIIWLLSSPHIQKIWLPFLRESRKWVKELNKKYPVLTNACDAEYTLAINWLRFLGFTFIKKHETFGKGKRPFLEFVRIDNG